MKLRSHLTITLRVNGLVHQEQVDARTTLLDLLREHLDLTGTKKGCNFGECGACTVHLNGRRVNGCLVLAASADGAAVTPLDALAVGPNLHTVHRHLIAHDALR